MMTIIRSISVALLLLSGCSQQDSPATEAITFDIILAGGSVYNGLDEAPVVADVGIDGDRIAAIGDLGERGAGLRLDVTGLVVAPGFIDIHNHAIRPNKTRSGIFLWPDAENEIRQGVTTVIGGPDGWSPLPLAEDLAELDANPASVNFGSFVGQTSIRSHVVGEDDRPATAEELQQMRDEVEKAMQSGAFGLSTGLVYAPGRFASTEEVIELAKVAGRYGGIYISHMRDEGPGLIESVKETIRIAEEGNLPAQITHHKAMGAAMWGKSVETLAMIDAAVARGVDITSDQYPYPASSTGLRVLFPGWSLAGNRKARLARYADPVEREKIRQGVIVKLVNDRGGKDPARVVLANCAWDASLNGRNLVEVLESKGRAATIENAAELVIELQVAGGCTAVYHAMSPQDVERIMQHAKTMIASDGGIIVPGVGMPHPRNYGAFARVLGHYVRERELLPLTTALYKMTRMPADRINITDRGRIEVGAMADIAVFDPATFTDKATFENPHQYAVGMRHVFVNGQAALLNGEMTGARPGRVLRSQ